MFSITEIIAATQGHLVQGPPTGQARRVSIDSRHVAQGDLFIAIKGDVFDGHDFIEPVMLKGVRIVLVHRAVTIKDPRVSVIHVSDTTRALGHIARFHRQRFKVPLIALTGSAGKTTTKEMITAVLSAQYQVLKNEGTQNNHIGVPLTLLRLTAAHQVIVLECGTNQPGDMLWLADIARPDIAVFTNIGQAHLEKLKTPQGVFKEKWALTAFMKAKDAVIINADDVFLSQTQHLKPLVHRISYALKAKAHWRAEKIAVEAGRHLCFEVGGKRVSLNSCGISSVYNALAAIGCGVFFKISMRAIIAALARFEFPQGRGQILRLGQGWLINDTYNANPVSMVSALQTLQAIETQGKRIFVAADMLELGRCAKALHRAMGVSIGKSTIDVLITVGPLAALMAEVLKSKRLKIQVHVCSDAVSAQQCLAKVFCNGDAVLIKGSRRMRMEQVAEYLLASPE